MAWSMRQSIFSSKRILIILVVSLLISSFLPARCSRVVSTYPRNLLTIAIAPATYLIKPWVDTLRRPSDLTVDLDNLEEYGRAKQQIIELQYKLSQANQRIAELSQIRDQLHLVGIRLIPASVIAWSADNLNPTLTINRGTHHNLRNRLVVTSGFNLIGSIINTQLRASTVRLITTPGTHIIVLLTSGGTTNDPRRFVIQIHSVKNAEYFTADTDADAPIQLGDLAHLYDDSWPDEARGFLVGKIIAIEKHPDDPILRRRIIIQPVRSLTHLDHVTVIVPTVISPTH